MGSEEKPSKQLKGSKPQKANADDPEWASGLKQLYDAVVEEELPDTFKNLLAKLDDVTSDASSDDGSPA